MKKLRWWNRYNGAKSGSAVMMRTQGLGYQLIEDVDLVHLVADMDEGRDVAAQIEQRMQ